MQHTCDCAPYRCSILPPHILDALEKNPDPKVARAARATRLIAHGIRVKRSLLAQGMRPPKPTGVLRRTIYDARQGSNVHAKLVRSEGQPPISDIGVDEAYDASGATFNFYKEVFKRISVDGHGMRLDSTVHFREDPGEPFDNAEWDGEEMLYGDGDGVVFGRFTKSLDVIGHELTHGVTQFTANLAYHDQPGALNESVSDAFGSMVKQWYMKQTVPKADWLIGAELFIKPGAAIRSMKAPGTAYKDLPEIGSDPQPATMDKYVKLPNTPDGDNGGVHINSGIPNRAFYLACVNLGAANSWDKAGKVWYAALTTRLTENAQFADAAAATVSCARELFGNTEADAVIAAWKEVGVTPAPPGTV
jgi:Zn-dependent metalloprotease